MLTYRTVCFKLNERHNANFLQTPVIQNTQLLEHMATKVQWSRHITNKNLPTGVGSDTSILCSPFTFYKLSSKYFFSRNYDWF